MISGIVLAGGTSSRLGRPKQLLTLDGRPVLQHVVDAAAAPGSGLGEVVVVLGHLAGEVASALSLPLSARTVVNPDYATGQAGSMRTGLGAAAPESEAAVVLLGDQPGMPAAHIGAVVRAFGGGAGPIVQASFRGTPSHPVLFARSVWPELMAVTGDKGAREVIKAHPDWVVRVDLDAEIPPDLDTMEDYERLRGR
ncbi:MAG TPA: nucleotidyltransferase family protein [Actinomycetota bacterium]|nr:nucleotidyltransferase family protein [Actinomycetota bacterium]